MSVKAVTAQFFQPEMRNWSENVSWREIEVFARSVRVSRYTHITL